MIDDATPTQLRTLTGVVYMFTNRINGKRYVGHTKHTVMRRYGGLSRANNRHSRRLKHSIMHHGMAAFQISILAHGIQDDATRETLETRYIREYDTLFPKGYNFHPGGPSTHQPTHPDTKTLQSVQRSTRSYRLRGPNGVIHTFRSLHRFGIERNLPYWNLHAVASGKVRSYRGYSLPETRLDTPSRGDSVKLVRDPEGNLMEIHNIAQFCRERGLGVSGFRGMLQGCSRSSRGYTCVQGSQKVGSQRAYEYILLEKEGREYRVTHPPSFAREHGIQQSRIYALVSGKRKSAHGFRLKSFKLLEAVEDLD